IVKDNGVVTTTNYLGGFQYSYTDNGGQVPDDPGNTDPPIYTTDPVKDPPAEVNRSGVQSTSQEVPSRPTLEFFPTAEGYYDNITQKYVYQYKDHLGNIRLSYAKNPATQVLEIIEENNYYPFGLKHKPYNSDVTSTNAALGYKYSGKELQNESIGGFHLNWYDMESRNYMPDIGRWGSIDKLSESFWSLSPYNFSNNNPVFFSDPGGLSPGGTNDKFASTIVDTNGTVLEHRNDGDPSIYLAGFNWRPGDSTENLNLLGFEQPGVNYKKGDKVIIDIATGYGLVNGGRRALGVATPIGGAYDVTGAWEAFFTELFSEIGDDSPEAAFAFAVVTKGKVKPKAVIRLLENLPTQIHHFATNKHSKYTKQMEEVLKKYKLKLSGSWNKAALPHLGRHPNAYHEFVLEGMQKASMQAGNDKAKFLKLFDEYVKQPVIENPNLLRKSGWE
ncbi:AHH domain-containing protein, partial [Flavobacterium collinsii]|uniref:AHH domain-containing protein n=2 Tax=Flavobacterium collinsii TaxID=1114861 RepID=UPI002491677A